MQETYAQIVLNRETLNKTTANKAFKLETPNREIHIKDIIEQDTFDFQPIQKPLEIIDFFDFLSYIFTSAGSAQRCVTNLLK